MPLATTPVANYIDVRNALILPEENDGLFLNDTDRGIHVDGVGRLV